MFAAAIVAFAGDAGAQARPTAPTIVSARSPAPGTEIPWRGGVVPSGYHLHRKPSIALLLGGAALFVAAYAPTAYLASHDEDLWWLALPVVGPLAEGALLLNESGATRSDSDRCLAALGAYFAILDGLAQAGGIAMVLVGAIRGRQVLRYEPTQASDTHASTRAWALLPGTRGAPLGLTLTLTTL